MGKKTGKPKGRPPGAKNKRTAAREAAMKAAAAEVKQVLGKGAFEGDAHALLMMVYKDQRRDIELRLDAAKGAIRFEKPALSAVDANVSGALTIEEVNFVIGT
jgi:hypothetical protein